MKITGKNRAKYSLSVNGELIPTTEKSNVKQNSLGFVSSVCVCCVYITGYEHPGQL